MTRSVTEATEARLPDEKLTVEMLDRWFEIADDADGQFTFPAERANLIHAAARKGLEAEDDIKRPANFFANVMEGSPKPLAADADEIVKRLRAYQCDGRLRHDHSLIMLDAASLIERQAAEIQLAWNTCEEANTAKRHAEAEIERQAAEIASLAEHLDRANQLDVQRIAEIERLQGIIDGMQKEAILGCYKIAQYERQIKRLRAK